ncbi:hypothetical protein RFI_14454 [Reticulomyxa filosa]|uniref:Uncharacterized protein n=1 Tax=Reticulomyxa filosa TaxID=46433 RepID=X6NBP1_RETFI|nr:hypothetical protein RFI_14454 [Reticulomyxa filosa]|eukprot:ETO22742.1 hypothetical protein RFI_14454 [Reticulomyxa filosa]
MAAKKTKQNPPTDDETEHGDMVDKLLDYTLPNKYIFKRLKKADDEKKEEKERDARCESKVDTSMEFKDVDKICTQANILIQELLNKCRDEEQDKACDFSHVYGVVLGGSLQKRLAIGKKYDGDLVLLCQMGKMKVSEARERKQKILEWITNTVTRLQRSKDSRVLQVPKKCLSVKFENYEFDLLVAFTYEKRLYCTFDYKSLGTHVYLFSKEELEMTAEDLMEHYSSYQDAIDSANADEVEFLKENMSAALTLLGTYYLREELIGKNALRAILLLKTWKYDLQQEYPNLKTLCIKSTTIEMLCVYAREFLRKRLKKKKTDVSMLSIIQQVMRIINCLSDCANKTSGCMLRWPYEEKPNNTLIREEDIRKWALKQSSSILNSVLIMDNIILRLVQLQLSL